MRCHPSTASPIFDTITDRTYTSCFCEFIAVLGLQHTAHCTCYYFVHNIARYRTDCVGHSYAATGGYYRMLELQPTACISHNMLACRGELYRPVTATCIWQCNNCSSCRNEFNQHPFAASAGYYSVYGLRRWIQTRNCEVPSKVFLYASHHISDELTASEWRRLHGARGAPWVEEQQTRNWPNCTEHHESAHQND